MSLVIVGHLTPDLNRLLAASRIRFENYERLSEEEVVDLYRSVDLVSFVSTLEGFGMPILEAQAIGRPVLTSNCSSMPEVAGQGALQVDPTSVQSIRDGLQRLLQDDTLRADLTSYGIMNVDRFSTASIASQYVWIYRSILDNIN